MAGRSRKTRSIPISALLDPALEERPESELPLRDFGWETDPYADHRPTRETQRSRCRYPRRRLDCGRAYLRRRFDRADGGGRLCRGESRLRTRATNPFHRNHRRMRSRAWVDLVSGCPPLRGCECLSAWRIRRRPPLLDVGNQVSLDEWLPISERLGLV